MGLSVTWTCIHTLHKHVPLSVLRNHLILLLMWQRVGPLQLDSVECFLTRGWNYSANSEAALLELMVRFRTGTGIGIRTRSTGNNFLEFIAISPNAFWSLKWSLFETSRKKTKQAAPQSPKWGKSSPLGSRLKCWEKTQFLKWGARLLWQARQCNHQARLTHMGGRIARALPGSKGSGKKWSEVRSVLRLMAEAPNHKSVYSRPWKRHAIHLFAFLSPAHAGEYNPRVCVGPNTHPHTHGMHVLLNK